MRDRAMAPSLVPVRPLLNLPDRFRVEERRNLEGNLFVNSQPLGAEVNLPRVAVSLSQDLPQRRGMEADHLGQLFSLRAF